MSDVVHDPATGIAIRFVKQFDIHTDKHPRRFDVKIPADWLTADLRESAMTQVPEHVMMTPQPLCARCGDYMLFLDRFKPPAFTARAFCGRCNYAVSVTAIVVRGTKASVDAL